MLTVVLALVWLVLAQGDLTSWPVGAAAVILTVSVARAFATPSLRGLRFLGAARFLLFFLWESGVSGVQVARLAVQPRLSLRPGLVRFQSRLPDESSRVFFGNIISLLPGTLTCGFEGATMTIHVLDRGPFRPQELRRLEERVAGIFAAWAVGTPDSGKAVESAEPAAKGETDRRGEGP